MKKEQFENYFKEYYALIFRLAFTELKSKTDAEDIVQELFFRILRYQPEFENREHEKAWMIRTTINLCRDALKNKWNSSTVGMDFIRETEVSCFQVPGIETDDTLLAVLKLNERYRQPLYLFYYEDYSIKEIAKLLHLPENTVKTNLKRGREKLKSLLVKTPETEVCTKNSNRNGDECK